MTTNQKVLTWLEEMKALTQPDNVVWIDGSEAQLNALREEGVSTGELIKLNEEKLPGCYLHRTAENDVARVEDRTFICTTKREDAGPTNNWMAPAEMYAMLKEICAERQVWYLDAYSVLCNEEGYLPSDVTNDGTHFSPAHYELWFDYMNTHYIPDGTEAPPADTGAASEGQP